MSEFRNSPQLFLPLTLLPERLVMRAVLTLRKRRGVVFCAVPGECRRRAAEVHRLRFCRRCVCMCVYVWCVCAFRCATLWIEGEDELFSPPIGIGLCRPAAEDHRRACAGGATKWTPRPAHTCAAIRLLAHGGELCPCDLTRLTVSRSSPLKAAYIAYPDRLAPCAGYGTTCA